MENIFLLGGALIAAHMITRGGGDAVEALTTGGGGSSYMSEEELDAQAYVRAVEKQKENTIGSFLSGFFSGNFFDNKTGEEIPPELTSDEDLGITVHVDVAAPDIEVHSDESNNNNSGPVVAADGPPEPVVYELPKTFSKELIASTGVQAIRVDFDADTQVFDYKPSQTQEAYESFSFAKPLHIAESNFFLNPVTIHGEKDLGIEGGPVQGWETLAAFKGGFDTVEAWRNAQDN